MADQINGTLTANESLGAELETQRTIELPAVLGDLADVVITDPQDGDVIKYDADQEKFVNGEDLNSPAWGNITGDIEDQTDLQNEFVTKFKETVGWICKNLFPVTLEGMKKLNTAGAWSGNAYTYRGITYTVNSDMSVSVSGSNTSGSDSELILCKYTIPSGRYKVNGIPSGASELGYHLLMAYDGGGTVYVTTNDYVLPTTGQTDKPAKIVVTYGTTISGSVLFKSMLRKESIKNDTYEPYHASVEDSKYNRTEANVLGAKNLIPCPYYRPSGHTAGNMTATYGEDGVITVNKTTGSSHSYFGVYRGDCFLEPNTQYIASLELENATDIGFEISLNGSYLADFGYKSTGKYEMSFTTPSSFTSVFIIDLHWASTTTETNAKVKVMIRLASDPDNTYEPYAKTNRQLTTDKCENSVIAPVENGATASQAYGIGEHFIRDGAFCTAKTAIAINENFTLNTNYTAGKVSDNFDVNNASLFSVNLNERIFPTLETGFSLSATNSTWYMKKGSKVIIQIAINKTDGTAISSKSLLFTLPQGYRPIDTIYQRGLGYSETNNSMLQIDDAGKVKVRSDDKGVYTHIEYEAFK